MKKFVLASLSAAILTACGGGSEETAKNGTNNTVKPIVPTQPPVAENKAPTLDLIASKVAIEQSSVSLTATVTDEEVSSIKYLWKQLSGPKVELGSANTATLVFTAPALTQEVELVFELTVTDSKGLAVSKSVSITVTPVNDAPVVSAGNAQIVPEQSAVTLSGEASDSDGQLAEVKWQQMAGTTVTLQPVSETQVRFIAPTLTEQEVLTFKLSATDNEGATSESTVSVTVTPVNEAPVVAAGDPQTVPEQTQVTLEGIANDSDGELVEIKWIQTLGTTVELGETKDFKATFIAPTVAVQEVLTFELSVTDNEGATASKAVNVTVLPVNLNPIAEAGINVTVNPIELAVIDGLSSSDPDGQVVSYAWTQVSGPAVELVDAEQAKATFKPHSSMAGETLRFELTVTDNEGATAKDTVDIYVNQYPTAEAGKNQIVSINQIVKLDGQKSQDDGQVVSYQWAQSKGTAVTLTESDTATPSFSATFENDEKITFTLTVTDDMGLTHSDDVEVAVVKVDRFINDTGVITSADMVRGNHGECVPSELKVHDCENGRDALAAANKLVKVGGGHAGFDFTKLAADGTELAADAEQWSCVRDNHTGLIWEVKTTDGGVQHFRNRYRWGGKGAAGYNDPNREGAYYEDWNVLVDHLNTNALCGKTDWVLPTVDELHQLVNYQKRSSTIDLAYFPNTTNNGYWTATPRENSRDAWIIEFTYAGVGVYGRNNVGMVRLVSGGRVNQSSYINNQINNDRYIALDDGTTTDLDTGLMWSRCLVGQKWDAGTQVCNGERTLLNWKGALEAGASFTVGGYENWRLPNIKELYSLVSGGSTAFNTSVLNGLKTCSNLWSSTPKNDSEQYNSHALGNVVRISRSSARCVLLVRDLN